VAGQPRPRFAPTKLLIRQLLHQLNVVACDAPTLTSTMVHSLPIRRVPPMLVCANVPTIPASVTELSRSVSRCVNEQKGKFVWAMPKAAHKVLINKIRTTGYIWSLTPSFAARRSPKMLMSALGQKRTCAAQTLLSAKCQQRTLRGPGVTKLADLRQNNQHYRHCNSAANASSYLCKGHELHPIAGR
jgi:hypothetical protein